MSFPLVAEIPATYTPYAKEAAERALEQAKQRLNPKIIDDRIEPNGDRLIFFSCPTEQANGELRMLLHICGLHCKN